MIHPVVLWLVSIQIVAAVVYTLEGNTSMSHLRVYLIHRLNITSIARVLFLSATLHLQIEYLIIAFLLGASPLVALGVAYIAGFLLLCIQLLVADRT